MGDTYYIRIEKVREDQFNFAYDGVEACGLSGEEVLVKAAGALVPVSDPVGKAIRLAFAKEELHRAEVRVIAAQAARDDQQAIFDRLQELNADA